MLKKVRWSAFALEIKHFLRSFFLTTKSARPFTGKKLIFSRNRADSDARIKEILSRIDELGIQKTLLTDDQLDRLTEFQLHNVPLNAASL